MIAEGLLFSSNVSKKSGYPKRLRWIFDAGENNIRGSGWDTVELVVEDMIIRSTAVEFWMDAVDFLILNAQEKAICLGQVVVDTVILFDPLDAVRESARWHAHIVVSPNPAGDWLRVTSADLPMEKIECFTLGGGGLTAGWSGLSTDVSLPLGGLPAGIFWVKIQTARGVLVKKLVKGSK